MLRPSDSLSAGRRGFSLIELLVVITIISILSAAAVSSFTNSQRRARDARRKSDLKAIQAAAEQYYSACGAYPASAADFVSAVAGAGGAANCAAGSGVAQFIQAGSGLAFPTDPRGGSLDTYELIAPINNTTYQVCADLELNPPNDTVDATWTAAQNSDDFCVRQLK